MQGVFLHVLADTLGSVGVIISAGLIQMFGKNLILTRLKSILMNKVKSILMDADVHCLHSSSDISCSGLYVYVN